MKRKGLFKVCDHKISNTVSSPNSWLLLECQLLGELGLIRNMRLAHSLRTGFALLCSVGLASFTIREILSYLSYPTTTDTDFVTIEELNFPAVSICSYYYK